MRARRLSSPMALAGTKEHVIVARQKWIIAAAVLAAAAKLYCAATTFGSGDVLIIARYGELLNSDGFDYLYRQTRLFNHPPLTGAFFAVLYDLSARISPIGAHHVPTALPFLLRVPSIAADFVTVMVLLKFYRKYALRDSWGLLLLAFSPAAFMTTGFHGNVDAIMVCGVVLAACFADDERELLCAIALGTACSIKVIPLLLVPAFFFFWTNKGNRQGVRFAVMFISTCAAGWSLALALSPIPFMQNVLLYPSFAGAWGITYLYSYLASAWHGHVAPEAKTQLEQISWLLTTLKLFIVTAVIALGWLRRKEPGKALFDTTALCWITFVVFAPGFVPYYLVWAAPFVLVYSARWFAAFTLASSIYLFAYYNTMSGGMPWNFADLKAQPLWVPWGLLPWLVACAIAAMALWSSVRGEPAPRARSALA